MYRGNGPMGPQNRGYQGQNPAPYYNRFAPQSNKIVVLSLEDALSRNFDYDSNMACWDMNKNLIYDIYTNSRGEKSYDIYETVLKTPQQDTASNDAILARIIAMEQKMEAIYGKQNGGQNATDAANAANAANAVPANAGTTVPANTISAK